MCVEKKLTFVFNLGKMIKDVKDSHTEDDLVTEKSPRHATWLNYPNSIRNTFAR